MPRLSVGKHLYVTINVDFFNEGIIFFLLIDIFGKNDDSIRCVKGENISFELKTFEAYY